MDFTTADMQVLAPQLRKPEGEYGRGVGKAMAENNNQAIAFTLECLRLAPTDHVLEIGFGPGEGIAQAVQLTPKGFVAGIDFSDVMLEMAEERNHRAIMEEHVELVLGEVRAMPFEDESFDKVFAVNVFHFWKDPMPELAECRCALRPGGRVAFFMAYPSSWRPGQRETGIFIPREPEDVEKHLRDVGFTHVESRTMTLRREVLNDTFKGFVAMGTKE